MNDPWRLSHIERGSGCCFSPQKKYAHRAGGGVVHPDAVGPIVGTLLRGADGCVDRMLIAGALSHEVGVRVTLPVLNPS